MRQKLARISGTRYRCRMRLVSAGGLDVLSQFFMDVVLDKEDRISVLLDSFGLPRRVIEDVLADLLERNRVGIDVVNGRILKTDGRPERRQYRLSPPFDVWQDEVTGAVLPLVMAQPFSQPATNSDVVAMLPSPGQDKMRDLMDLPAARALGALLSADPSLKPDQTGWIADGLVDVERISAFDLYLAIAEIDIDGSITEFISGEGLPAWLTRAWSFDLRTSDTAATGAAPEETEERGLQGSALIQATSRARQNPIFDQTDLAYMLQVWRRAFDGAVQSIEGCIREGNLVALEQLKYGVEAHTADVVNRILDGGRIVYHKPARNHLHEIWNSAGSYVLLVQQEFSLEDCERIWAATEGQATKPVHLILLDGSGQLKPELEGWASKRAQGRSGGELLVIGTERMFPCSLCVADGREVRFGDLDALFSAKLAVRAAGAAITQLLISSIAKEVSPDGGGWWVLRHVSPAFVQVMDQSSELAAAIEDFEGVARSLAGVIDEAAGTIEPENNADAEPNPGKTRAEELELASWNVCSRLLLEAQKDRVLIVPIPGSDLMGTLERALFLASSDGAADLQIVLAEPVKSASRIIELLRPVAKNCRSISLVLCPAKSGRTISADLDAAAGAISRIFASEGRRIAVVRCMDVIPTCLILDNRIVAMGWGAWFEPAPHDRAQFGFAFKSPDFVSELQRRIAVASAAESR